MQQRAAAFDAALAALIEDLCERGLDRKVAVVLGRVRTDAAGQQERRPRSLARQHVGPGGWRRDEDGPGDRLHQRQGRRPRDRPLHPNDVLATVYRHLGIDLRQAFVNNAGRPIPILPHGEPIAELPRIEAKTGTS